MSETLAEIRKKIDTLDDRIHDLLMERADLIVGVTEEKKKNNIPVVQPAREAMMIRRLLNRHRGPLPEATIVGIWRELVGAVSLLQTGLKVSVSPENYCWDGGQELFRVGPTDGAGDQYDDGDCVLARGRCEFRGAALAA